ncbi:MAG: alpha/beta hydrolase, partial [Corynebacterium sp.]|nr:alpha/beta hydrolase [Corynebacterium sp.]
DTGPSLADATLDRILDLRLRASRIGSVRRGILWNHRMRTAVVPLNWVELAVERPVLFIHAQQRLWNPVVRRAALRARHGFTATTVPGAKNLPHVEAPAEFVSTLGAWLQEYT